MYPTHARVQRCFHIVIKTFESKLLACNAHHHVQALRREADGKALVLLDEVGTGTDPAEGAALGIALLRALVAGGPRGAAFTMATTHHRCNGPHNVKKCISLSSGNLLCPLSDDHLPIS